MPQLPFQHLRGASVWSSADHQGTTVDAETGVLRLAARAEGVELPAPTSAAVDAWLARRGAAVELPVAADACLSRRVLGVHDEGNLHLRDLITGTWRQEALPAQMGAGPWSGVALWRDTVVLAERGQARVRRFAWDTLEEWARWSLPAPVDGLCATAQGLLAWSSNPAAMWLGLASSWVAVPLHAGHRPLSAWTGLGRTWVVLHDGSRSTLFVLQAGTSTLVELPGAPAGLVELTDDATHLWLGTLETTGPAHRLAWTRHVATASAVAYVRRGRLAGYLVDTPGRACIAGAAGEALTSSSTRVGGPRTPLVPRLITPAPEAYGHLDDQRQISTEGRVETRALDSQRYGCMWHRVFLDVCLPEGTHISVDARTSDSQPPEGYRHPRPPLGSIVAPDPAQLGSADPYDDLGWEPVGVLLSRPAFDDRPFPAPTALPSEDALPRGEDPAAGLTTQTLEGLLKNPGGRYLWLRIHLHGREHATPRVVGVRVTYPRPSMLRYLPAFWRADAEDARRMDQLLALFEGHLVEQEGRIDHLPLLFRATTAPADALDWLASFVGLTLDTRLSEGVRRQLLLEIASLFRQRGTVPGLERLLGILARASVLVLEDWRSRHPTAAVIGALPASDGSLAGAILGPGLQLGAEETLEEASETGAKGTQTALTAWYKVAAHRFMVLVLAEREAELEDILQQAIETHKPAHTTHTLCWAGAGLHLGQGSFLGLSTVLGRSEQCPPVLTPILGADPSSAPFGLTIGGITPDRPTVLGGHPSPSLL